MDILCANLHVRSNLGQFSHPRSMSTMSINSPWKFFDLSDIEFSIVQITVFEIYEIKLFSIRTMLTIYSTCGLTSSHQVRVQGVVVSYCSLVKI